MTLIMQFMNLMMHVPKHGLLHYSVCIMYEGRAGGRDNYTQCTIDIKQ